ncbi:hypothetical protein COB11_00705 [Candidatus Aerophobetes bacterium]|uniref:Uncharacterized protein n=1 Tax=Aerophobetes bacterium TaxID=2030807 RepID=A0A2A4YM62_UNCAE|nr:MAG: hypothetical protein COB11_00705 [Candidatus Aerophobetes bacterium]
MLQHIKEKLNSKSGMVLLSYHERIHLDPLLKDFIKQPGRIMNATGNIEDLRQYKISENMKHKFESI